MVGAQPGFTFAMMVNPLARVFGMGDPKCRVLPLHWASVVLLLVASSLPPFDFPENFYHDVAEDTSEQEPS